MDGDLEAPLLSAQEPSMYEVANALFNFSLVAYTVFAEINLLIGLYWRLASRFYFTVSLFFLALTITGFWIMGVKRRNFFADRANKEHWCEQRALLCGVDVALWGRRGLWLPGLSWLVITVCDPMAGIWSLIANTFPQYILNLSYSLEHKELTHRWSHENSKYKRLRN